MGKHDLDKPFLENKRQSVAGAIIRGVLVTLLWAAVLLAPWYVLHQYAQLCRKVPDAPNILDHQSTQRSTEILASDGIRLGGGVRGRRPWTSIDDIPPVVIGAFLAAEDEGFFEHDGIDPWSVLRAAATNVHKGSIAQGGSTITQQVAKIYVGRERTYERKLTEAMLARRIEARFTKLEILEAYLNRIYLGASAVGVEAAAQRYFGRSLQRLEVHQAALIAGLTAAPSRLNPFHNPDGALDRRRYVLDRMRETGLIDEQQHERSMKEPLALDSAQPDDTSAPYLVDETRRALRRLELRNNTGRDELTVETTANVYLQRTAVDVVSEGAANLSRRRQDRAELFFLRHHEWDSFLHDARRGAARVGDVESRAGLVTMVSEDGAIVQTGSVTCILDAQGLRWAREKLEKKRSRKPQKKKKPPRPATDFLRVGSVVQVQPRGPANLLVGPCDLLPAPDVQGALISVEVDSGEIRALAGGTGYDVTQFNRATRGCRQPGSAFKPVVYSRALEHGLTAATLVHDLPIRYEDTQGRLIWEPRNADRNFKGTLTLAEALARSRNLPTVKLAHQLGTQSLIDHATRLGIRSPMSATPSLALGASCVKPVEITAAYGAFASGGVKVEPHLVRSVYTRSGKLLYENGKYFEPAGPIDARLVRLSRRLEEPPERVIDKENAYLTTYMLRQVVEHGTADTASDLPIPVAGKTGTTNQYDVWFVGFSEDQLTGVWLGDDRNLGELGEGESGGTSALPVWSAFLRKSVAGRRQHDPLRNPPPGIEFQRIDPSTGLLAHARGHGVWMPFAEGTAPHEVAPAPIERAAHAVDILEREF